MSKMKLSLASVMQPLVVVLVLLAPMGQPLARPVQAEIYAATFTVNSDWSNRDINPGDGVCETGTGDCTLSAAIQEANAHAGADLIQFDPSITNIPLYSSLPALADTSGGTTIKGNQVKLEGPSLETCFRLESNGNKLQGLVIRKWNTGVKIIGDNNVIGTDGDIVVDPTEYCTIEENVRVDIEIEGDNNRVSGNYLNASAHAGVRILDGASGNLIGTDGDGIADTNEDNTILAHTDCGVSIWGAQNVVAGNYIGTTATGQTGVGNQRGVCIFGGAENRVGTNGDELGDVVEGNVISGNGSYGIVVEGGTDHVIAGNYIGTNAGGTAAIPNSCGISVDSTGNRIGTNGDGLSDDLEGNVISGNIQSGIYLGGSDNVVAGNLIGTRTDGVNQLGNGGHGIWIGSPFASGNTIGGAESGAGNRIAFNGESGIRLLSGTGNALRGNEIFDNDELGIDLDQEGVTPNDAGDQDSGANAGQNYPQISLAFNADGLTIIMGSLDSRPTVLYTLDFFASDTCDPAGYGEGETYLGSIQALANASGQASFYHTVAELPINSKITATATDDQGNTSEFSACATVAEAPPAGDAFVVNSSDDVVDANVGDGDCDTGSMVGEEAECTLRAAIQQANSSAGADVIILPADTYLLTIAGSDNAAAQGDLDITDDVQLVGAGAATTIVDANSLDRVFHVDPSDAGLQASLSDVTIQGGTVTGSGAGIYNQGTLTLTHVTVQYNHAQGSLNDGGGVYNGGALTILGSTLYSNTVATSGGGVATGGSGATLTAINSTFSGNQAGSNGGGIYVYSGDVHLNNVTLTENVADSDANGGGGGGIRNDMGTVSAQNTIIAQNSDQSPGGYELGEADCSGTFTSGGYNLISDRAYNGTAQACNGFSSANNDTVGGYYLGGPGSSTAQWKPHAYPHAHAGQRQRDRQG